jgi:transcriptional regulator GlxA family with amidase domain
VPHRAPALTDASPAWATWHSPALVEKLVRDRHHPGISAVASVVLLWRVSAAAEDTNRRMLRARDAMDRDYGQPLEIHVLAKIALMSPAHFIRSFKATFAETPHRYLQRRRVERAMWLMRSTDRPITDICADVGFNSLSTFSRTFKEVVGEPPSAYRARGPLPAVPSCFGMAWRRPSSFGQAPGPGG